MNHMATWASRVPVAEPARLVDRLRKAGFPLAFSGDQDEGESDNSQIVCVAAHDQDHIRALVASPSGLVFRFEPEELDPLFWGFAMHHYYMVTGNMADRRIMAEILDIPVKQVTGRALLRKKSNQPSGLSLDQLLAMVCEQANQSVATPLDGATLTQADLF